MALALARSARIRLAPVEVRALFVENEDSFSFNVVDRLPCDRRDVVVAPGRALDLSLLDGVDALVIGPGPTDPIRAGLVDLVRIAAARRLPTLGICLGHQALGLAFGARLVRTLPHHGKRSIATFEPSRAFAPFVGRHVVMRYHSLALTDVVSPLRVVAKSEDGVVMAVEHASLPMAGLQFHPDSFATPEGELMIAAFFEAFP